MVQIVVKFRFYEFLCVPGPVKHGRAEWEGGHNVGHAECTYSRRMHKLSRKHIISMKRLLNSITSV